MKRSVLLAILLTIAPSAARAQVELGMDAGVVLNTGFEFGDDITHISIPFTSVRFGIPTGGIVTFESLFGLERTSDDDDSLTQLSFVPGLSVSLGEAGAYVRGEVAIAYVSFDGESQSQLGLGVALGLKKAINGGPVSYRLEAGFDRWLEDEDEFQEAYNAIRFLIGLSAAVGG
ncbi:MAG TPA: hypothetical protein VK849_08805 [Longimicrobiales bacterium]|nr:hypothetical protein [Longimicrobiales bacterium]